MPTAFETPAGYQDLQALWTAAWPQALAHWSRFTKLTEPRWCFSTEDEQREGLTGSFAMIRLVDQAVVVSLSQVKSRKLERFAVEICAHEIGHHVYCPAHLNDHGRMLARIRRALPSRETEAPLVANLYADLLINDRLQRSAGLDMAGVYLALGKSDSSKVWRLYMRMYEILWRLPKGDLGGALKDARSESDAVLGARLIRHYSREWLDGSGRFAALMLPYLLEEATERGKQVLRGWADTQAAGQGAEAPGGLAEISDEEANGAIHPALDPALSGIDEVGEEGSAHGSGTAPNDTPPSDEAAQKKSEGQYREPFEYGALLRSLGMDLTDHEVAARYYRERALPHLVRFPTRDSPRSADPLPEGLDSWDIGQPLDQADWLESVFRAPQIIPGFTTVQRAWGVTEGENPERRPLDLDLYVDCSGSMPNPQHSTSFITLTGAIIALSALRAGARVQATLWSGAGQFETTGGFVADWKPILRILTGYLGGGTAFPIHLLRDTYPPNRPAKARPTHILVLSDEGVDTMFAQDERGNSGWDVARASLQRAGGGGTLALNLFGEWTQWPTLVQASNEGWAIYPVKSWEELVAFARDFSRANYERTPGTGQTTSATPRG
jgi:hypothetical protein